MPVLRFNKTFSIARDLKAFLNLESGVTRGAIPHAEYHKELAENLRIERRRNHKQKRTLGQKRLEIFQLRNELSAMRELVESASDVTLASRVAEKSEIGALPDFVIIGAQKSGTTSLYHLLVQHPNIEPAAVKEVHYFNRPEHFARGIEWYRRCFPPPRWKDGRRSITGEATPAYLFYPLVPERMAEVVPEARLIVLLRNPVDRAYSHYHKEVRSGNEPLTFEEAIEAEETRLRGEEDKMLEDEHYNSFNYQRFSYLLRGIYVDQLLRWRKFFSDEQMLVLKSEDFFERPQETLKLVLDFLGLPYQESNLTSHRTKHSYEPMDPATRRRLEEYFGPHNQRLYEYLGVDFGW